MSDATAQARAEIWGGGVRPYAVPSKKLGMWLFIVSDSLTFSVLLVTYSYVRLASTDWPTPFHGSSIALASIMTFCLLSSSLTMVMAVAAAHQDRRKQAARWLFATIAGGLAFIVLHANEWLGLIHEGMRPFSNPWGSPLFRSHLLYSDRPAHDPRRHRGDLPDDRGPGVPRRSLEWNGRGGQRAVLALCRFGLDVHFPARLFDVDQDLAGREGGI